MAAPMSALLGGGALARPAAAPRPGRAARIVVRAAGGKPSWQLDTPGRLWELNETWYPGATAPDYLDASLAGDRGFDPLRLAANEERRPWLVEGELYNGRVAMLAAAGILLVELVGRGPWWAAPSKISLPLGYWPTVVLLHTVIAAFEAKRWSNFQKYKEGGLLGFVPFDPLGLNNDAMRQREVRNGRLAMLANLGFWSQAANTGKGPLANLQDHLADPTHNNICSSKVGLEVTFAALAIALSPIVLEARKTLSGKEDDDFRPIPFL